LVVGMEKELWHRQKDSQSDQTSGSHFQSWLKNAIL
jgi:hypothetical protein